MKIIFDFDDVLFDAKAFKELMFFYLEERGIRNARDVYVSMRAPDKTFPVLEYLERLNIPKEDIDTAYEGIVTPAKWLVNQEVLGVAREVGMENIFILSLGEEAFQRDKIERALSEEVLDSHVIVVSTSKREEVVRICMMFKDEEIIFVDDKVEFLNNLPMEELPNLKTVLFNETGLEKLKAAVKEATK